MCTGKNIMIHEIIPKCDTVVKSHFNDMALLYKMNSLSNATWPLLLLLKYSEKIYFNCNEYCILFRGNLSFGNIKQCR